MIEAAQSDWLLQAMMVVVAVLYTVFMSLVLKSDKEVAILLMQGFLGVSSIVVVAGAFNSQLFSSAINQRLVMIVPAMMTLIYLGRDVFNSLPTRHHDEN